MEIEIEDKDLGVIIWKIPDSIINNKLLHTLNDDKFVNNIKREISNSFRPLIRRLEKHR